MSSLQSLLVALTLAGGGIVPSPGIYDPRLEGIWVVTTVVGEQPHLKGSLLQFYRDTLVCLLGDGDVEQMEFRVGLGQTVRAMDFVGPDGSVEERCLYDFEGDRLGLAVGQGMGRPDDLPPAAAAKTLLLTLERQAP